MTTTIGNADRAAWRVSLFRPFLLVGLIAAVLGCSRTELIYDNADWLVHRWASRLVDASSRQREDWRDSFRLAHERHRQELLPEIVEMLRALETQVAQGFSAESLHCVARTAEQIYRDHARLAVPLAAQILSDLSADQIAHLAGELDEQNREYRDDYLDPDPVIRERKRVERLIDRTERWTDRLTDDQVAIIEKALRGMPNAAEDWLAYRRQQQAHLFSLLTSRTDSAQVRQFLIDWWVESSDQPPALADKLEQIRRDGIHLALALYASLTPEQRIGLGENLAEFRGELEGVSRPGEPSVIARAKIAECSSAG